MTMPSKAKVFQYWKERLIKKGFLVDCGEPSCWACGESWNGKYYVKNCNNYSSKKILTAWEKAPLQCCYIVPLKLGGTEQESNLFLLCKQCDDFAPKTCKPEIFFEWARIQNIIKRFNEEIQEYLDDFCLQETFSSKLIDLYETEQLRKRSKKKTALHNHGYAGWGKKLTTSTFIGLLVPLLQK